MTEWGKALIKGIWSRDDLKQIASGCETLEGMGEVIKESLLDGIRQVNWAKVVAEFEDDLNNGNGIN